MLELSNFNTITKYNYNVIKPNNNIFIHIILIKIFIFKFLKTINNN